MIRRHFVALAMGAAAIAMASAVPRPTWAQGTRPNLEILVLYAKKDAGPGRIDKAVPKLPQLSEAPFNAYNTFELIDRRTFGLGTPKPAEPWLGKPSASYQLVTGKSLDVALIRPHPDGRYHMGAVLGKDAADRIRWNAPMNEPFFIAGQSYKDGILVIGITLVP